MTGRDTWTPGGWTWRGCSLVEFDAGRGDLVSFRSTVVFESDGAVLTSTSTLRFRHRDEVAASLAAACFLVDEVRQAPDRPGRELVFLARRADTGPAGTPRGGS